MTLALVCHHQSQPPESVHSLPTLQDERSQGSEKPSSERGRHVQDRHEDRRLFPGSPGDKIEEISKIQVAGEAIRVPLPMHSRS